jgi:2-polyprenyl-6-hydroxyphenyl methylase/3-demethylubiquinone-9 3-methyltransferase
MDLHKNIDPGEIRHFDRHAVDWWDPKGPLKALHDINPVRLQYIEDRVGIEGNSFLDIGCGGGILTESLALAGGCVTGIDMTDSALLVAREHLRKTNLKIEYRRLTAEDLSREAGKPYDVITCMELLEHVPRPASVLDACKRLLKPGGDLFIATLNRTWTAYVSAILAAEYVLKIVRKGTHSYRKFIRPEELARWATTSGLVLADLSGFLYNPFSGKASLSSFTKINYLMHLKNHEQPLY